MPVNNYHVQNTGFSDVLDVHSGWAKCHNSSRGIERWSWWYYSKIYIIKTQSFFQLYFNKVLMFITYAIEMLALYF